MYQKKVIWMVVSVVFLSIIVLTCSNKTGQNEMDIFVEGNEPYKLVWSDEFDYTGAPDQTKWTYEHGFVRNEELQWYQPENAFCENGLLVIEGRKETFSNPNYKPNSDNWRQKRKEATFTSASVTTKNLHSWSYGRFEIKAKIKAQNGLWPAIWTLGSGHEWPSGGEIDIMEYYDGNILANAAWAGSERWKAIWDDFRKPVSSFGDHTWTDKFHLWRMDWDYESIKIYLDDELLNTIPLNKTINQRGTIQNPFRETAQFLILNLAIGGTAGGDPSGTTFPSRYEIDYVRVYQK